MAKPAARPLLLGHRGARKYAPENTITAFELALDHGCDGFEFDVRVTVDRQAVVCHDSKLKRAMVARSTLKSLQRRDAELPVLQDVLSRFEGTAFLNVEIKVAGVEEFVIAALRKFQPINGVLVSSFLPAVIRRFAELGVKFDLGLICENRRQSAEWASLPIQAVMLERKLVSAKAFESLKSGGKQVFVWTVNSAREMRTFATMGVDGIISDDTKLLATTLIEFAPSAEADSR